VLGVGTGDRIEFVETAKREVVLVPATRSVRELNGIFKGRRSTPVAIEEMNEAIAQSAAKSR
jgi:bifunctional DNA-binding transcriptional regulator/antitoxin component of YhaV-PrlF toxin-antitoxin module